MRLNNIINYCLKNFYHRLQSTTRDTDGNVYKNKEDIYTNLLNNTYVNGTWYIGWRDEDITEDMDEAVYRVREIKTPIYLVPRTNGGFNVGFYTKNFLSNHDIFLELNMVSSEDIRKVVHLFMPNKYPDVVYYNGLSSSLDVQDVDSINISCESVMSNHIQYLDVDMDFNSEDIRIVSAQEWDSIMQDSR